MLNDSIVKVKEWGTDNKKDLIIAAALFLVALTSFGLGRLSVLLENRKKTPISITHENIESPAAPTTTQTRTNPVQPPKKTAQAATLYVGSKNSNKYHLPDCPGALKIKEENKIWFSSKKEAESLGYTPAANCNGL